MKYRIYPNKDVVVAHFQGKYDELFSELTRLKNERASRRVYAGDIDDNIDACQADLDLARYNLVLVCSHIPSEIAVELED